jgi:hypothetical protein
MPDRQTEKLPFRMIEVVNVNQNDPASEEAEISSLSDPALLEDAAIRRLDGCIDLYQVEQAKAAPTGCPSTRLRAKITLCGANTGRLAS